MQAEIEFRPLAPLDYDRGFALWQSGDGLDAAEGDDRSERIKATEPDRRARIAAHVTPKMKRQWRALSGILFLLAFIALAFLLLPDLWLHFRPTVRHRRAAAFALIFAGASLICLQLSLDSRWRERLKGVLLGLAFVLWGSEQYLPAGPCVTAIDSAVIAIFVLDLALVIGGGLGRRP